MKIFIHGNGDYATEINDFVSNYNYYKKYYHYEISFSDRENVDVNDIRCVGFSHTDTLHSYDIEEIKNYYHFIASTKKQDVFEKYINDNNLPMVKHILIDSPIIKHKNKIDNGVFCIHARLANYIEIGRNCYIGAYNLISNRVKIGNNCFLFQRNTIDTDCEIGDNTFITTNVVINKKIKIGKNCYIGPNQVIFSDLEDNSNFINGKIIKGIK